MATLNEIMDMVEQYKNSGGDSSALFSGVNSLYSTGKTSLGLNQWVKSDKPMMEEFNEDNRIVDEKLRELLNTLEDKAAVKYGIWTPSLVGEASAGNITFSNSVGYYYKVGRMVTCFFGLGSYTAPVTAPEGIVNLTGLPFPIDSGYIGAGVNIIRMGGFALPSGAFNMAAYATKISDEWRMKFQFTSAEGAMGYPKWGTHLTTNSNPSFYISGTVTYIN